MVREESIEGISWAALQRVPFETLLDVPNGTDPQKDLLHKLVGDQICQMVSKLPERQQKILRLYFQEDRSQAWISSRLNLSEGRISQLRIEAIDRLKVMLSEGSRDLDTPHGAT
jgi:RNA polymerase sigma factor for flagellar operon FliA